MKTETYSCDLCSQQYTREQLDKLLFGVFWKSLAIGMSDKLHLVSSTHASRHYCITCLDELSRVNNELKARKK